MRIGICNDHAGYAYKCALVKLLGKKGHEMVDFGTDSEVSVDYPDYAHKLAAAVEQALADELKERDATLDLRYEEVMLIYDAALRQMETKLSILSEEFQLIHRYNPIEHTKARRKTRYTRE